MGLETGLQFLGKVAINYTDDTLRLARNLGDDVSRYTKACGKRSILETKPSIFHGINPTISYPPSGKVYELPRFCTQEMQQARKLNQIAIRQIKQPINSSFPNATIEDLRRLTSETIEDSFSRVQWTNPKDGKVYHLLKQGETENGNVIVRILDHDGTFIKEAQLTPKNIKIYDSDNKMIDLGEYYEKLSHGEVVTRFARRANPFAKIEYINIDHIRENKTIFDCHENLTDELNKLHQAFINGDKTDYISLSIGLNPKLMQPQKILEKSGKSLFEFKTSVNSFPTSKLIEHHPNLRILQASSNAGQDVISPDLMFKSVEGVGSLDLNGKIADFSASRSSILTQHYEQGVFKKQATKYGLGYFDAHSTDIALKPKFLNLAQKYVGKKPVVDQELSRTMTELKKIARKKYEAEFERIRKLAVTTEEDAKLNKLKEIFRNEKDSVKKKIAQDNYWDYRRQLYQKVEKEMINYENPEGLLYKRYLETAEKFGLVHGNSKQGYYTFERTPYKTDFETLSFMPDNDGNLVLSSFSSRIFPLQGTSFSTPIRTAKLALNDMMEKIL